MSQLLEKLAERAAERRWNSLSEKNPSRMRSVWFSRGAGKKEK